MRFCKILHKSPANLCAELPLLLLCMLLMAPLQLFALQEMPAPAEQQTRLSEGQQIQLPEGIIHVFAFFLVAQGLVVPANNLLPGGE